MSVFHEYPCPRCPLVVELGGHTAWNEHGVVHDMTQIVCTACGTMHRLSEGRGLPCQAAARTGPVRGFRPAIADDIVGDPVETREWDPPGEWVAVGPHPGGVADPGSLACNHCGQGGRMLSLAALLYPDGYTRGAVRREVCPVCAGPVEMTALSDTI